MRAQERDLASRLAAYSQAFDDVHRRALVVRQLLPFLEAEAGRFDGMSRSEKSSGALTGSVGSGAVAAILDQVAGRLLSLKGSVLESLKDAGQEADEAREHLKAMRDLLGAQGEFEKRLSEFADHAVALEALMARMSEQSVLPAIKQTAGALDSSLIMPATSSRSDALAGKQAAVMQGVSTAVHDVGVRLADAAAEIEQQQPVSIPAFMPLSRAEAILVYARDFLPAWAAAVSIDLMPLVIVLILTIVRASDPEDEPQSGDGVASKRRGAEA